MVTDYTFDCSLVDGKLVVRGDCDLTTSRRLGDCIAAQDEQDLELDLRGVTFFDSTALGVLLAARQRNPGIRVGEVSQEVAIVLKITGTFRYLREPAPENANGIVAMRRRGSHARAPVDAAERAEP